MLLLVLSFWHLLIYTTTIFWFIFSLRFLICYYFLLFWCLSLLLLLLLLLLSSSISQSFFVVDVVLLCFVLFLLLINNSFSHMKLLSLVDCFAYLFFLFIYFFLFSSLNRRGKIHNLTVFLQFPKCLHFCSFIANLKLFYILFSVLLFLLPFI